MKTLRVWLDAPVRQLGGKVLGPGWVTGRPADLGPLVASGAAKLEGPEEAKPSRKRKRSKTTQKKGES